MKNSVDLERDPVLGTKTLTLKNLFEGQEDKVNIYPLSLYRLLSLNLYRLLSLNLYRLLSLNLYRFFLPIVQGNSKVDPTCQWYWLWQIFIVRQV
jgi:hypothetical protein